MKKTIRKKITGTIRKGSWIIIAAVVGSAMPGSINHAEPIDIKPKGIKDVFDEHYYADTYPDLKLLYGYDRAALLDHFMKFGLYEGRTMNEMIDIVKYREMYPDLQAAFGDNWNAYVTHYLTYGAFERRDNGTDFDPVAYLERYEDLKESFGNDLLSAYRHYENYGKLEGREARSEIVLKAEEATRKQEEITRNAQRNTQPAAAPSYSSEEVSSNTPEEPSAPVQKAFEIRNVEVLGSGRIRVTLNQKTGQPLAQSAFSILCNSGGSDMTILSVSTEDTMVYYLSTAYYRDQEYDIQITLADGTSISKVFTYRTDCAQISGMNAVRTSADKATVTYNSDEPGYFYYILSENMARAAEPAEDEIINNGIRVEMKQHENVVTITGLSEGMSYTMYYVAVNTEGKSTLVQSLPIEETIHEGTAASLKRVEAFEEKQDNGEYLYGFEIELDSATPESLTLDQFNVSCPQHETALGEVRTSDNRIYRVYMQSGSVPKGNNTYTILISLKDGTQLKDTCYLDLQAPRVSIREFQWANEHTVTVTVNSDEAGSLYYRIQDEVEGAGTTAPKDPAQIYAEGTKVSIGYGLNYITVENVEQGQWFCCASEDAKGNREAFYSYKEIPEYTGSPDEEQPSWPQITRVEAISATSLKVVFDKPVNELYENGDTQISGLNGKLSLNTEYGSEGDITDNVLNITIMNMSMSEGSHTLTIVLNDGTNSTSLRYDFEYNPSER